MQTMDPNMDKSQAMSCLITVEWAAAHNSIDQIIQILGKKIIFYILNKSKGINFSLFNMVKNHKKIKNKKNNSSADTKNI